MKNEQYITLSAKIPENLAGLRLDQALSQLFSQYSRSQLQQWIKQGNVTLDQHICQKARQSVIANQSIEIRATLQAKECWEAQEMPLNIIFEDDDLMVINKAAGVVVHPGAGQPDNTLVNALLHHCAQLTHVPRAGMIHRIDKDTSGVLIIAKNLESHHSLTKALKERSIKRYYKAIVKGEMISGGSVNAPIGRHPQHRTRMAVVPMGREALTHYRVIEKFTHHTFLDIQLETGRTHQIRVHMTHIHHPLVGDPVYGKQIAIPQKLSDAVRQALRKFNRQALHAYRLSFLHPISHELLELEAPLPEDMQSLLNVLRENYDDLY